MPDYLHFLYNLKDFLNHLSIIKNIFSLYRHKKMLFQ